MQLTALLDTLATPDPSTFPASSPVDFPCRTGDAELWFAETPAEVEAAKALCGECPVRDACLAGALERREPWGVWGGQLLVAGAVVARKRPRGRPRKHPLPEAPSLDVLRDNASAATDQNDPVHRAGREAAA